MSQPSTQALRELIARWNEYARTDHSKGMKLSDARKQGQHELLMAGQSLAYATAAKHLEALLPSLESSSPIGEKDEGIEKTGMPIESALGERQAEPKGDFETPVDKRARQLIDSHPGCTMSAAYRAVALELSASAPAAPDER